MILSDQTKNCGRGEDYAKQAHGKKDSLQNKENNKSEDSAYANYQL